MREQLNNNPLVQMGVIAVLLLAVAIFLLTSMGGGGEESESGTSSVTATESVQPTEAAPSPGEAAPATSTGGLSILAERPLPNPVMAAWNANRTVALLVVKDGGIDDDLVKRASSRLAGMPGVSTFVVPADQIARYSAITQSVGVDRVPALIVLGPKRLNQSVPTASVSYGFQNGDNIAQAVIDAGYKGPTLEYHP